MVDEPDSPPQETERIEREENEEGGGDIYRLNEISLVSMSSHITYHRGRCDVAHNIVYLTGFKRRLK